MAFLDTTMLVGAADRRDACHGDGRRVLTAIAEGVHGRATVSDFVMDETLTILAKRQGVGPKRAVAFAEGLLASPRIRCVHVDAATFTAALKVHARHGAALSFTDATTVTFVKRARSNVLYSHDEGFDRIRDVARRTTP